jgi:hypothetical protein
MIQQLLPALGPIQSSQINQRRTNLIMFQLLEDEAFHCKVFDKFPWLDWNEQQQKVFCFPWRKIHMPSITLLYKNQELTFVETVFCKWSDVTCK